MGAIFLICLAAGCAHRAEEEKHPAQKALSKSDYEALREEVQIADGRHGCSGAGYPIRQGTPPLAVLVPAGNSVRVINADNGARGGKRDNQRDAIVSVDAKAGVTLGGAKLANGPLGSAQAYAIYIESVNPNVAVSRPTTLPAKQP
jgi:hypothetical protein